MFEIFEIGTVSIHLTLPGNIFSARYFKFFFSGPSPTTISSILFKFNEAIEYNKSSTLFNSINLPTKINLKLFLLLKLFFNLKIFFIFGSFKK